jgi:hypothetical protein
MPKPKIGRPPIGPVAFQDVSSMMNLAFTRILTGSKFVRFNCETESNAIRTIHRMNRWRQITRKDDPYGNSRYDQFTIRRDAAWVIMQRRPEMACVAVEDDAGSIPLDALRPKEFTPLEQMLDAAGNIRPEYVRPAQGEYDPNAPLPPIRNLIGLATDDDGPIDGDK